MRVWHFAIAPLIALAFDGVLSAAPSDEFLGRAVAEWAVLDSLSNRLEGEVTVLFGRPAAGSAEVAPDSRKSESIFEIALRDDSGVVIFHEVTQRRESVSATNKDYSFSLSRAVAAQDWLLTKVRAHSDAGDEWPTVFDYGRPVFVSSRIDDVPLARLVKSPSFQITSMTPDGGYTRLDFKCDYNEDENNKIVGGSVVLDPNMHCAVRSYVASVKSGLANNAVFEGTNSGVIDYQPVAIDGCPIPATVVCDHRFASTGNWRHVYTFKKMKLCTRPDAEFRLAAYGLPEPQLLRYSRWKRPGLILLNLVAVSCLLLAVYLRRRATVLGRTCDGNR